MLCFFLVSFEALHPNREGGFIPFLLRVSLIFLRASSEGPLHPLFFNGGFSPPSVRFKRHPSDKSSLPYRRMRNSSAIKVEASSGNSCIKIRSLGGGESLCVRFSYARFPEPLPT